MPSPEYPEDLERIIERLDRAIFQLQSQPATTIENVSTVASSGASLTLVDVDVATMHDVTLDDDCALTFPDPVAGKSFSLWLRQDGTGGRVPTWDAAADWGGGSAPTLSTAAGAVDVFGWACVDGSVWTNLGYVLDSR